MIILILSICCALYFFYLYHWTQSCLKAKKPFPHSADISIIISTIFGIIVVSGIFWGYTENPYKKYLSIKSYWIWSRESNQIFFLFAICAALGLSYMVIYYLGYIKAKKEYSSMLFEVLKSHEEYCNYHLKKVKNMNKVI